MKYLKSVLKLINLNTDRFFDHLWRVMTGLPQVTRSEITPDLYVGGQYYLHGIKKIQSLGITAIINMRMSQYPIAHRMEKFHILHLPTPDYTAPTMADLEKGIRFIRDEIKNGGKVYIHCHLGEGRGPTMAIAYLISSGLTFEDAVDYVKNVRPFIRLTEKQLNQLEKLAKKYALLNDN